MLWSSLKLRACQCTASKAFNNLPQSDAVIVDLNRVKTSRMVVSTPSVATMLAIMDARACAKEGPGLVAVGRGEGDDDGDKGDTAPA